MTILYGFTFPRSCSEAERMEGNVKCHFTNAISSATRVLFKRVVPEQSVDFFAHDEETAICFAARATRVGVLFVSMLQYSGRHIAESDAFSRLQFPEKHLNVNTLRVFTMIDHCSE